MGGVVGKTYTAKTAIVYEITNCYTTVGDVIPTVGYEKPNYYTFTDCAAVSESALINEKTTLTYGYDGYSVIENELKISAFEQDYTLGDVNGDGNITLIDVIRSLKLVLNGGGYLPVADMNVDNVVNLLDVIKLFKLLAN